MAERLTVPYCTLWACVDCLILEANGEVSPDRPTDQPEPLCLVDRPDRVTLGMTLEDHAEDCPNRQAGECVDECECEDRDFSWSPCDLCGSHLGGSRHAFTWWVSEAEASDV